MVGTRVPLDTADLVGDREWTLIGLTTGRERTLLSAWLDLAVLAPGWAGTVLACCSLIPEPREDAPSLGRERWWPPATVYRKVNDTSCNIYQVISRNHLNWHLETRGETRCPGGVNVSCIESWKPQVRPGAREESVSPAWSPESHMGDQVPGRSQYFLHGVLKTKSETRCQRGVSVSCMESWKPKVRPGAREESVSPALSPENQKWDQVPGRSQSPAWSPENQKWDQVPGRSQCLLHGVLKTKSETRYPGGVSVSCMESWKPKVRPGAREESACGTVTSAEVAWEKLMSSA